VNEPTVIEQCPSCLRYHAGGAVVAVSWGDGMAAALAGRLAEVLCGLPDCASIKAARLQRDSEHLRRFQRGGAARRERRAAKQACQSARQLPPHEPARLPYKDAVEADGGWQMADGEATPQLPTPISHLQSPVSQPAVAVVEKALSQRDFVASGKADSSNLKLREFFDHVIRTGQMGNWFSRKFLKSISGNDYINNRVDDLRPVYAERGIKIVNGEVSPDGVAARTSHYRLLMMTDGEFAKWQATKEPPTE
jgi:hypothetical protein